MNAWELIDGDNTLLTHFDLNEESIVIDAGGYMGDWSAKIIEKYNPYITIYEPVKEFYDEIYGRFATNLKVEVQNQALWIFNGLVDFGVNNTSSGIYCYKNIIEVKAVDVVDELDYCNKIDLMKINIEGAEIALLLRMVIQGLISKVDNILIQFHSIGNSDEIRKELAYTHELIFSFPYIWEHWRIKK